MRYDRTVPQPIPTQMSTNIQPSTPNDTIGRNVLVSEKDDDIMPDPIITTPSKPP